MRILKPKIASGLMLGAAFLLIAGVLQAAPEATAGLVYTANEGGNSISALDLSTGQVKATAVKIMPHNVQASRDGRLLLAVGMVGQRRGTSCGDGVRAWARRQ